MCSVLPVHSSPMLSCDRSACFASSCSQGGQGGLTHVVTQRYLPHFFRSYFSAKSLEPPPRFRTTADRQDHVEHTEAQHKHTSTSTLNTEKHKHSISAQAQAQARAQAPAQAQAQAHTQAQAHKHKHKHGHPGLFSETMHSSDATTRRPLMLDLW